MRGSFQPDRQRRETCLLFPCSARLCYVSLILLRGLLPRETEVARPENIYVSGGSTYSSALGVLSISPHRLEETGTPDSQREVI